MKKINKQIRKHFKIDNSPYVSEKQVMDQEVLLTLTYGCQIWSPNKQLTNKELLKEQWMGKSKI